MLEKTIERYFANKIKNNKGECIKFTGVAGLPDRIILLPGGKVFFVEFKRAGEAPRKIQEYTHNKFRSLGFKVYVVDSKDKTKEVFEEWNLDLMTTKNKR